MEVKAPETPPPARSDSNIVNSTTNTAISPPPLSPQPQESTSPNSASPLNSNNVSSVLPPSTPPPPLNSTTNNNFNDEGLPQFARNKPVLSTAVTGSLAGFALGLLFGSPSAGALVGGGLGAVVSSRDDEVGAKAREMGTEGLRKVNSLTHKLSETETGMKLRSNLADAVKRVEEVDANYKISNTGKRAVEKAVLTTSELNRQYHIDDRIYSTSNKFAQTVMEKLKSTNPPVQVVEGMSTARKAANDLNSTLGITESLTRTVDKLKGELKGSSFSLDGSGPSGNSGTNAPADSTVGGGAGGGVSESPVAIEVHPPFVPPPSVGV